jgi:hypothetical protein
MLFNFGILSYIISLIGVLAGSYFTFLMLEKRGIFPGLPFPILLGIAGGVIASLVA